MNRRGEIYTVRYVYTINGRTCTTTWCGRADTPEDAVGISSEWFKFAESGATVVETAVEQLKTKKDEEEK